MIDRFRQWATEKVSFRQRVYKRDIPLEALSDLGVFCGVWDDGSVADVSDARLRELHGRRQAFFRLWKHLKLSPVAFETAYQDEIERRARVAAKTGE